MGRTLPVPVACKVCGDKSFGRHYGVYCCDGCSCFFKRSVRKQMTYTCISGDGKCIIDRGRRNWCPYCRFEKCLAVAMSKSAVQDERGPRRKKFDKNGTAGRDDVRQKKNAKKTSVADNIQTTPQRYSTINNSTHDLLVGCVKEALQSPILHFLEASRKQEILLNCWPHLLLFHTATSSAADPVMQANGQNKIQNAVSSLLSFCKTLILDPHEVHLANSLLLCAPATSSEAFHAQLLALHDLYRMMLCRHQTAYYTSDPLRSAKVLFVLSSIKNVPKENCMALLFGSDVKETEITELVLCYSSLAVPMA